ncbi:MAG: 4-hydroxythreonine-4-phosphate dehydrogenase PdxA [Burkholderiales bacterium]|nr:4-hydroxythreonine-4-phosphate dehydrogenase PdxA [Burkholderiales bacterium]
MSPKRVGITMGDPSGIGPEIIVRTLNEMQPEKRSQNIVIGNIKFLERANDMVGSDLEFCDSLSVDPGVVPVVHIETIGADSIKDGVVNAGSGEAVYRYVREASSLISDDKIAAIVTAPLSKSAMHMAGHKYDGHTELLAELTGAPATYMLLAGPRLSAIHVTTHTSLANAAVDPTIRRVLDTIRIGNQHFKDVGYASPRLAVAGLNPHCGEGGLFGDEEAKRLIPAVAQAKAEGINVEGPISGDTVFYRALNGEFDLVVAQYHDQGHIPTKLIGFNETVNVSLGLPICRTSVDHGTAFDIAWKGIADHTNMTAAIAYAHKILKIND